jgi:hypothetical protein
VLLAAALAGCMARPPEAEPERSARAALVEALEVERGGRPLERGMVSVTATVEEIDLATRTVVLRTPRQNLVRIQVDDDVRNLPQVRVGDRVVATYYESVAIEVHERGETEPGVSTSEDVRRAPAGAKPARSEARRTAITATVVAVDRERSAVTVQGPEGTEITVAVENPQRLARLEVGDLVEAVVTEAFAIAVGSPQQPE